MTRSDILLDKDLVGVNTSQAKRNFSIKIYQTYSRSQTKGKDMCIEFLYTGHEIGKIDENNLQRNGEMAATWKVHYTISVYKLILGFDFYIGVLFQDLLCCENSNDDNCAQPTFFYK